MRARTSRLARPSALPDAVVLLAVIYYPAARPPARLPGYCSCLFRQRPGTTTDRLPLRAGGRRIRQTMKCARLC
jgi:hypothetical protein